MNTHAPNNTPSCGSRVNNTKQAASTTFPSHLPSQEGTAGAESQSVTDASV